MRLGSLEQAHTAPLPPRAQAYAQSRATDRVEGESMERLKKRKTVLPMTEETHFRIRGLA